MIIKLHEVRKDAPYPTYINTNSIQFFAKSINGNDTRIKFAGDNTHLFVKESVEEIVALMSPPILATVPFTNDAWDNHAAGIVEYRK